MKRAEVAIGIALVTLSACATPSSATSGSEHLIVGPKGYTVDWGLPQTGAYWVPEEAEDEIKPAAEACGASPSVFVYHHIPRPPWFSYLGLRFDSEADEQRRACMVARLRAVPALTAYPKRQ